MQFNYNDLAGVQRMTLNVKEYSHLFKVRRVTIGQKNHWRNLKDKYLYTYEIESINKKEAILNLLTKERLEKITTSKIHVGWCIIDPKSIEKSVAMLNEMGVKKISFVYADFSQKNYKIDEERLKRIFINSSEQCGRDTLMEVEILQSVEEYLNAYPKSKIIDFCENYLHEDTQIDNFLVGPEGGFSEEERKIFENQEIFGLKSPNILKSETAVVGICAKLSL